MSSSWSVKITLPTQVERFFRQWAVDENRSPGNLASKIVLDAIAQKQREAKVDISIPSFGDLLTPCPLDETAKLAGIAPERLEKIAKGARPDSIELIGLSRALGVTSDQLIMLRRAHFGNGNGEKTTVSLSQ